MTPESKQFVELVRRFLNGTADWDSVHDFAVEMEWQNKTNFSHSEGPLSELHMVFLADSKDDQQFRADKNEVAGLLAAVDNLPQGHE
jgi:hypothetical protein